MGILKNIAKVALGVEEHGIPELTDFRLDICNRCSHFNREKQICRACGCFMDIKATLTTNRNPLNNRVEVTHCPHGLWNDVHITNMYRKMDGKSFLRIIKPAKNGLAQTSQSKRQ